MLWQFVRLRCGVNFVLWKISLVFCVCFIYLWTDLFCNRVPWLYLSTRAHSIILFVSSSSWLVQSMPTYAVNINWWLRMLSVDKNFTVSHFTLHRLFWLFLQNCGWVKILWIFLFILYALFEHRKLCWNGKKAFWSLRYY